MHQVGDPPYARKRTTVKVLQSLMVVPKSPDCAPGKGDTEGKAVTECGPELVTPICLEGGRREYRVIAKDRRGKRPTEKNY